MRLITFTVVFTSISLFRTLSALCFKSTLSAHEPTMLTVVMIYSIARENQFIENNAYSPMFDNGRWKNAIDLTITNKKDTT